MNQAPARDIMRIFVDGNETPGFILYGLAHRARLEPGMQMITDIGTRQEGTYLLTGDRWEVLICEISVVQWPVPSAWEALIASLLDQMVRAGAVVAWIDIEGAPFADPPQLFAETSMSGAVLAWITDKGESGGRLKLDEPLHAASREDLDRLRHATHGLADAT